MTSARIAALWCALGFACGGSSSPGYDAAMSDDAGQVDANTPVDPLAHCAPAAAPPSWVVERGDDGIEAQCGSWRLHVQPLAGGIVRLRYARPDARPRRPWAVPTMPAPASPVRVSGTADGVEVCTAEAKVRITAAPACRIELTDASGRVLVSDGDDGGFVAEPSAPAVVRHTPAGERFYGFGEKTGALDKRGRQLTFWNTDAYDPALGGFRFDQDPLYQSIPFFIGLRDGVAYGVFTDWPGRIDADMAATDPERYRLTVHGDAIDQYVVLGPNIPDVVRRYTSLTGRPPLPPRWALGYHQSRWGYSPASLVEDVAVRFRSEGIPADAMWLDIQHMDGFRTFSWSPGEFGDPAGLIARLGQQGFKVVAIADPGIKVDPGWSVYDSGLSGDHFLRTTTGEVFEGVVWPGPSAFPDFTSPGARSWWADQVRHWLGAGLRGVWLDVNEPTVFPESGASEFPISLPVDGDGNPATMAEVHNAYALLEASATREGMLTAAPTRRPFVLSRAGYAGIQRYAAVWTGDVVSDWAGLGGTLPMLLGMGLSGLPVIGSDVGGYSGHATPELFARWMAVGSISPFFRAHVTSGVPGQEPWQFGTEVRDVSRNLIRERYRLLPYWYSLMAEASATGAPPLRPLVYHYQDDPATHDLGDQAMIGPFLLAAPVIAAGTDTRTLYLPAGRWYEYHSGAAYDGPATITVSTTLAALPLFVRAGAIIPKGPVLAYADEAPLDPLHLDLYPAPESTTFTLYEDDGDGFAYDTAARFARTTYELQQTATGARLRIAPRQGSYVPPARRLSLRLRRVDGAATNVRLDGVELPRHTSASGLEAAGHGWWLDERERAIVVVIVDQAGVELSFDYAPAVSELRPPVEVEVEVRVPKGTPIDPPIHIATSANGWTHQPLTWTAEPGVARGTITVPRGEWFFYKFTRGGWNTVEKWPECAEATNRYRFGAATLMQVDTVYTWSDWCP